MLNWTSRASRAKIVRGRAALQLGRDGARRLLTRAAAPTSEREEICEGRVFSRGPSEVLTSTSTRRSAARQNPRIRSPHARRSHEHAQAIAATEFAGSARSCAPRESAVVPRARSTSPLNLDAFAEALAPSPERSFEHKLEQPSTKRSERASTAPRRCSSSTACPRRIEHRSLAGGREASGRRFSGIPSRATGRMQRVCTPSSAPRPTIAACAHQDQPGGGAPGRRDPRASPWRAAVSDEVLRRWHRTSATAAVRASSTLIEGKCELVESIRQQRKPTSRCAHASVSVNCRRGSRAWNPWASESRRLPGSDRSSSSTNRRRSVAWSRPSTKRSRSSRLRSCR